MGIFFGGRSGIWYGDGDILRREREEKIKKQRHGSTVLLQTPERRNENRETHNERLIGNSLVLAKRADVVYISRAKQDTHRRGENVQQTGDGGA